MHESARLFRYTAGAQPLEIKHLEACSYNAVPRVIGSIYAHVYCWWSTTRKGWYALLASPSTPSRPLARHAKSNSSTDLRKLHQKGYGASLGEKDNTARSSKSRLRQNRHRH
jgi:hypothetical protein